MKDRQRYMNALEKIKFIFYNIILGVIGWLVLSFMIQHKGNLILGFVPFLIYFWFLLVSNEKSKWHIFENANVISKIIIIITILIMTFIIGSAKVFFYI